MTIRGSILGRWLGFAVLALAIIPSTAALAAPEAICVPWKSFEQLPHWTYSGANIRLKGIARGDAVEFKWEYGDGGDTGWMLITNPYDLSVQHVYTGVPGQLFLAVLHVRNAGGEESQDTYRIRMYESTDLRNNDHLDVRVNMAIDEGLWRLHVNLVRMTYGAGSPGYGQPYGYWNDTAFGYPLAATGSGIEAFQLNGHKVNGDYDKDPYTETVQRAMNYLLASIRSYGITPQPAGNPDTNGNGFGLVANNTSLSRQTYIGGICMAALASSGARNVIAKVGRAEVVGRKYRDIVQDMVDFFAFGQVDSGWGRGGWRYSANYSESDMSTAQWPPLGMLAAEQNMNCVVPDFVRPELQIWLNTAQYLGAGNLNGAFAYYYPGSTTYYNVTKNAAGLISYEFLYLTPSASPAEYAAKLAAFKADPRVQAGMGYIYRHWNDSGTGWDYTRLHGNSYGMYGMQKAMRITDPPMKMVTEFNYTAGMQTGNEFDWFYWPHGQANQGIGYYTVSTQQADGSWDDTVGYNAVRDDFATAWRILVLSPRVTVLPPVAVICNCDKQEYNLDQTIELDGSCSYHLDIKRTIIAYEWDLDNDGSNDAFGVTAQIPGGFDTAGIYPVTLTVWDDTPGGSLSDTVVCEVYVHEPPHCPHAYTGGPYTGSVGVAVQFDASKSWDPDDAEFPYIGDMLEYALIEWDLDSDGLYGTNDFDCFGEPYDAIGTMPQWTWQAEYHGTVGLKVTDLGMSDDGQLFDPCTDYGFTEVDIGNQPPHADAGGPYEMAADTCITLDGSGSSDGDPGDSISFAWDLDGDGEFDDSTNAQPQFCVSNHVGEVFDIALKVTDLSGEYDVDYTTVTVSANQPPVAVCQDVVVGTDPGVCYAYAFVDYGSYDPDGDPITIVQNPAGPYPLGTNEVTLTVTDDNGASDQCTATVVVEDRTPPEIHSITPTPPVAAIGQTITFAADVSDICDNDVDVAWDYDDGTGMTPDTTHVYAEAGVYNVDAIATDDAGNTATGTVMVVVYDPSGKFVTGGGWIDSPAGAYKPDPSLSGKANFGFVSKYKKGKSIPEGNTEFQFKAGDLNFHSDSYEWLVINKESDRAQYKGVGTINGVGVYRFMLWAGDSAVDTFRIRIWEEDAQGVETDVYDNGVEQPIGRGSIVIHDKKEK